MNGNFKKIGMYLETEETELSYEKCLLHLLFSFPNIVVVHPLKHQSRLQQTTFINTFSLFFREKRLDISCKSSARQRIHMKHQALFSSKYRSKK